MPVTAIDPRSALIVTLPVDAMTDSKVGRHEHSLTQVFPGIAESGTTADVLTVMLNNQG